MLVLTRTCGKNVVLIENNKYVRIKVLQINGNQVRLGFEADRNITILREELLAFPLEKEINNI